MLNPRYLRKFFNSTSKLLLIAILWLGGTYAFEAINSLNIFPHTVTTGVSADGNVQIWWPTQNVRISNTQSFKGMVEERNLDEYTMFWAVDDGQPNQMWDSSSDYPHKEAMVDLRSWTWRGSGPYKVTFRAVDKSGTTIGQSNIDIFTTEEAQGPTVVQSATAHAEIAETVSDRESQPLNVWWPTHNAIIQGVNTFKVAIDGMSEGYSVEWQVDGGHMNTMYDANTGGPHKEAEVNVSGWAWQGTGPYTIKFIAKDHSGKEIASKEVAIQTGSLPSAPSVNISHSATTARVAASVVTAVENVEKATKQTVIESPQFTQINSANPLSGAKLYVNSNSDAKRQANEWRSSRSSDAYQLDKIAAQPEVTWLGGWNNDISGDVRNNVKAAEAQGAVPIFVAYNIPARDCGQYSAGGLNSPEGYRSWIRNIADAIGNSKAAVILEPDALTLTDCLQGDKLQERYSLLSDAVSTFKSKANIAVYIDAGHPGWISADDIAGRLKRAGVEKANGFALNTSNFYATPDNIAYGESISGKIGGKHFVIDTGRNGLGPTEDKQWCNPSGRALGNKPTTNTGNSLVDAYLWVKGPGGSDGNCNGGPSAGTWWPEYAVDIAKRAAY